MSHNDTHDTTDALLNAPVNKTLLLMSAPISLGMLSTFLFQVVDTYFVAKLGSAPLAALGFAATVYFLLVGLFMGVAVGVSSLVAKALGQKDIHLARRYTTVSLVLALALSIGLSVLGIFSLDPLFQVLGAKASILPHIRDYMVVLYLGLPLLIVGLLGGSALRATGDVKPPEIVMMIAGVINVVVDPILIFGAGPIPKMGIRGAAVATVLSWAFIFVCTMALLLRKRLLTLHKGELGAELRELGRLSLPATLAQALLPITSMFVTYLTAKSGSEAVAAFGVATRIETLLLVGILAMSVAIVPFVAQNYGAQDQQRIDQAIVTAGKTAMYWGGALFIILVFLAAPIARMFSHDPTVLSYTKLYFYLVAFSYAPYGIVLMTSSIFNGVQIPGTSLRILLVKTFVFTFPLTFVGSYFGVAGIFAALSASNLLGFLYASRSMKQYFAQSDSNLEDAKPMDSYIADWRAIMHRIKTKWSSPSS